nr:IS66 family transposase [Leptospira kirschneri]
MDSGFEGIIQTDGFESYDSLLKAKLKNSACRLLESCSEEILRNFKDRF